MRFKRSDWLDLVVAVLLLASGLGILFMALRGCR
jgi:hypothetical protein